MIKYRYQETEGIKRKLIELEAMKIVFEKTRTIPEHEERIRRESLLKSSLYSAKIEGIADTPDGKTEINNLLKAYKWIYLEKTPEKLEVNLVTRIHQMAMERVSSMAGKFRREAWAIFNSAGVAVYLAPPWMEVPKLVEEYVDYINDIDHHPLVVAGISQYIFEKIHPFADGNGRCGRLLSAYWLKKNNYHFKGILPFEEYTDNHREEYYQALEPNNEMTEFVEYFLTSLIETAKTIPTKLERDDTLLLPPRREEIVRIVIDHPYCSFDFLKRRFGMVNPKTLHYDLKKLQEMRIIGRVGVTRGATYIIKQASPKE